MAPTIPLTSGALLRTTLESGARPLELRLQSRLIDWLVAAFGRWPQVPLDAESPVAAARRATVDFLRHEADRRLTGIAALEVRQLEFSRAFAATFDPEARVTRLLDRAAELGASSSRVRGDRRALDRSMDSGAIEDRYSRRLGTEERDLSLCLGYLGKALVAHLDEHGTTTSLEERWKRAGLEAVLRPAFLYRGEPRVRLAAFQALAAAARALPSTIRQTMIEDDTVRRLYRTALDTTEDVWIQGEAIALVGLLSPGAIREVLQRRLGSPAPGDDLFVRARAVRMLGALASEDASLGGLLIPVSNDPSPFVRQALAAAALDAGARDAGVILPVLLFEDPCPEVRAAALFAVMNRPGVVSEECVMEWVGRCIATAEHPTVLRTAFRMAADQAAAIPLSVDPFRWNSGLSAIIESRLGQLADPALRRSAAEALERIWVCSKPAVTRLHDSLTELARGVTPGGAVRVPRDWLSDLSEGEVGRVMAVASQRDFSLSLESGFMGPRLWRGHRFGFRTWRLLHELAHPSPDKRQAHSHTIGRHFRGTQHAPSGILAELAATRVPGEPLHVAAEGGDRNFLPLVDEVLSSLEGVSPGQVKIFTCEGVTFITPPGSLFRRLRARIALTRHFARYAALRNWREGSREAPDSYVRALEALGFDLEFVPHRGVPEGVQLPVAAKFLPAFLPGSFSELWIELKDYFLSSYANTPLELVLFTSAIALGFLTKQVSAQVAARRARSKIPLVIGGWGTRGKSGTERLKAALFNALGAGVVSKTTGCEAMLLVSRPFGRLHEMFLYRPYDKATIWEQHEMLCLAAELETDVFLWECMALNPDYVELLQQQWVTDDLSTLTNAYPDHEDIQGPAGIDIPAVMTRFIPVGKLLITSEEEMLPILACSAGRSRTAVRTVDWLDSALLAPDVLSRFPYAEHPANIALVLRMATELGIEEDFALKEMADRVVPDLGVLKVYPMATVRGRRLDFANGMSANEKKASVENWMRLGFDRHDRYRDPGTFVTVVVNNRADRVPRSRVFSGVIVNDMPADRYVFIGSNLEGLMGYTREAFEKRALQFSLHSGLAGAPTAEEVLDGIARSLRIPFREEHVRERLEAALRSLGINLPPEKVEPCLLDPAVLEAALQDGPHAPLAAAIRLEAERELSELAQLQALRGRIAAAATDAERRRLDETMREQVWTWYASRVHVVKDHGATGDQILENLVQITPPGLVNHVMGIQNIKGPGLDFVYRWQAWETCQRACARLKSPVPSDFEEGLRTLRATGAFGVLGQESVRETLLWVKTRPLAQREGVQASLELILQRLDAEVRHRESQPAGQPASSTLLEWIAGAFENFSEARDAIRRRKRALQIQKDLVQERISFERASRELSDLMKRQKGGWMVQELRAMLPTAGREDA